MRRWSSRERWFNYRDAAALNLDEVAKDLISDTLKTLNTAVRVSSKLLSRIETQLDESMSPRPLETNPSGDVAKAQSDIVTQEQSNSVTKPLSSKDLATLATALKDSSEVLLRVFDK